MQKAVLVLGVGPRRKGREVDGCEQSLKGRGASVELQPQHMRGFNLHSFDPISHHIAQRSDSQKPAQAEGHGLCIKAGAVVETNICSQRDRDEPAIGADRWL